MRVMLCLFIKQTIEGMAATEPGLITGSSFFFPRVQGHKQNR